MKPIPKTGAAQFVEIRERIEEIKIPKYVESAPEPKPPLFAKLSDGELLGYGVPSEWLPDVRKIADEDGLLELADHLPKEAAEALLDLATGKTPQTFAPVESALSSGYLQQSQIEKAAISQNRLSIQMHNGASGSSTLRKNWSRRSTIRGRSGLSFSILRSGNWWKGTTTVRHGSLDRQVQARLSLRFTVLFISLANIQSLGCC